MRAILLSDRKPGHYNQSLGVIERLPECEYHWIDVKFRSKQRDNLLRVLMRLFGGFRLPRTGLSKPACTWHSSEIHWRKSMPLRLILSFQPVHLSLRLTCSSDNSTMQKQLHAVVPHRSVFATLILPSFPECIGPTATEPTFARQLASQIECV